MNPTDIVFATEESRIKARKQYLLIHDALRYSVVSAGQAFDRTFPPIVPPKMVPWEGWCEVDETGNCEPKVYRSDNHFRVDGLRWARVRVEEIPE